LQENLVKEANFVQEKDIMSFWKSDVC
jgi:hypothetical protein